MGYLTQLMGENKTSKHFGSLNMSFKSIIDITKKVPCLESIVPLCLETYLGWKTVFNRPVNEIWEVGRVWTKK